MIINSIFLTTLGVLFLITAIYMQFSFLRTRRRGAFDYFVIYILYAIFSFFTAIPLLMHPNNLEYAGKGYIVSVTILLISFVYISLSSIFLVDTLTSKYRKQIAIGATLIGILALSVMIFDTRTPIAFEIYNNLYIIGWNLNPIAGWSLGILTFTFAWIWAYINFKNSQYAEDKLSKLKSLILFTNGVLWGIGGLIYFPSSSATISMITFILVIIPLLITALAFWILRFYQSKYGSYDRI